jgi:phospholipid/cholesterol/gamma-HCH transport system substrate-binding protein
MLGILVFIIGAAVQNRWLERRVVYHTYVVRGDAVRSGLPVLLSGIEIGEIGELTILKDNRIDVELLIRAEYTPRIRRGTVAEVRRVVGLGEKRVLLVSGTESTEELPQGAVLPANEPMDIIDAISNVDLGRYINTMDRAVNAMEITLKKLEEKNRLERMMEAFDQMGPTLMQLNSLLTDIHKPLVAILTETNFKDTFDGAAKVFNDPNTRKAMAAMAQSFDPKQIQPLTSKMETAMVALEGMASKTGSMQGAMEGADRLFHDKRFDKLLTSMDKLSDADKLTALVDNMSIVAKEMAKMGPEIPALSKELLNTLREAVIVLKAMQKSWLLRDETKEVKKEKH